MTPHTQPGLFDFDDGGAPQPVVPSPTLPPGTIVLLDLNYTLVANSWLKRKEPGPYRWQISRETYRTWLIDLIAPHTVLLVTVRGQEYRQTTLSHIQDLTGWQPDAAFFNPTPAIYRGDIVKHAYLIDTILPRFGLARPYLALESFIPARRMYQEQFNIPALNVEALRKTGFPAPTQPTFPLS